MTHRHSGGRCPLGTARATTGQLCGQRCVWTRRTRSAIGRHTRCPGCPCRRSRLAGVRSADGFRRYRCKTTSRAQTSDTCRRSWCVACAAVGGCALCLTSTLVRQKEGIEYVNAKGSLVDAKTVKCVEASGKVRWQVVGRTQATWGGHTHIATCANEPSTQTYNFTADHVVVAVGTRPTYVEGVGSVCCTVQWPGPTRVL